MVYTTTSSMIGDRAREERKQQPGPRTYSLFELRTAFRISTWGVYRRKTLPSARTALVLEERKSSLFFYIFNSQWWYPPNVTNNFRCRPLQPIATASLVLTDNNKNILLFILGEFFFLMFFSCYLCNHAAFRLRAQDSFFILLKQWLMNFSSKSIALRCVLNSFFILSMLISLSSSTFMLSSIPCSIQK